MSSAGQNNVKCVRWLISVLFPGITQCLRHVLGISRNDLDTCMDAMQREMLIRPDFVGVVSDTIAWVDLVGVINLPLLLPFKVGPQKARFHRSSAIADCNSNGKVERASAARLKLPLWTPELADVSSQSCSLDHPLKQFVAAKRQHFAPSPVYHASCGCKYGKRQSSLARGTLNLSTPPGGFANKPTSNLPHLYPLCFRPAKKCEIMGCTRNLSQELLYRGTERSR
jgi:hypothetical protein